MLTDREGTFAVIKATFLQIGDPKLKPLIPQVEG
jgi:hypothetical protein